MNDLFLDLWSDLREKRLWPIALALLLCVIAVPVVLAKSSAPPPAPEPVAIEPSSKVDDLDLEVVEGADRSGAGSSLDGFASKNPFKPPAKVTDSRDAAEGTSSSSSSTSSPGDAGEKPSPTGGGGDPAPPEPAPRRTRTQYEYVADVTFWNGNRRRVIKGMTKLEMLPSESMPMLIFMGVTGNGSNAVFLVDSTLKAAGEGSCSPSRSNCAFVRIGPGAEHTFTDDEGDSYTLRIDEIRKAKIGAGKSSRKRGAKPKLANASLGDQAQTRRFSMPFLSDLTVVDTEPQAGVETPDEAPSDDPAASR